MEQCVKEEHRECILQSLDVERVFTGKVTMHKQIAWSKKFPGKQGSIRVNHVKGMPSSLKTFDLPE